MDCAPVTGDHEYYYGHYEYPVLVDMDHGTHKESRKM